MNCINCGKQLVGKQEKFCGDKCRMAFGRRTKPERLPEQKQPEQPKPEQISDAVRALSREEIYDAINAYPQDTWKDSPEFKELERRLKEKPLAELKEEGYWIPSRIDPNPIK